MEINNTAIVFIYKGELSNDFNILNEYNIVIITEIISLETAETLNQYCRMKKIGFIYTSQLGLSSFLFTDFGEDFIIEDMTGLEPEKYYIKSITNSCPGIVTIDPIESKNSEKKFLKIGTGDYVSFREVKGMTELNDTPPRPVRVLDKIKFTIEDTSKFQEFTGSGIAEEIKVPRPGIFKPLSEATNVIYYEDVIEEYLNEDMVGINCRTSSDFMAEDVFGSMGGTKKINSSIIEEEKKESIPWIKMFYEEFRNESLKSYVNEKMHLAFLTLHEFFNIHQDLPEFNKIEDTKECINISLKILSKAKDDMNKWAVNLQKIDKPFLENVFRYSRFNFTPFINFFAGIVSEEILKYTGILKPSSQWVYFNFYSLLNSSFINYLSSKEVNEVKKEEKKEDKKEDKSIDINIFNSFNIKLASELKSKNILIIGLNDIAYEILKIFIMLDILNSKDNKIIIISTEDYEIKEKLEDLKNYNKNKNINIIKETFDQNNNINLEEKKWWNKSDIIIDSLSFEYYSNIKLKIIEKSKENKKNLISINANKYNVSYELILPDNNNDELCLYKEEETPKGDHINTNDINNNTIKEEEENYENYKNLCSLEEALKWSEDLFENNFIKNIKYLNLIIEKSNSESDMIKYIDEIFTKEKELSNNNDDINIQLIKNFKKLVTLKLGMNFETIVFYSIELFEDLFSLSTEKILSKFPSDLLVKGKNEKFWSGKRKEPKKILFDINNEEHFELIYCMTYLFCKILKIEEIKQKMIDIKKIIEKYEPKKPDTLNVKKVKLKEYSYIEKFSLVQFLRNTNKENLEFTELEIDYKKNLEDFDNLESTNKQLKFIVLAANIKLSIYGLNQNNKSDAICKELKINMIHPPAAACIAGAVVMQICDLILNDDNNKNENEIIENEITDRNEKDKNKGIDIWRKNCAFNLGNNTFLIFDAINK